MNNGICPIIDESFEKLLQKFGRGKMLRNYIVPGLTSTLLGKMESGATIRLFEMERDQEHFVVPHDHRYNFDCRVLAGEVVNRVYEVRQTHSDYATHVVVPYDQAKRSLDFGDHASTGTFHFVRADIHEKIYKLGDWYRMEHNEFHSIVFSRRAKVLFIEGVERKAASSCLLPYVNKEVCNTFQWRDWMMKESA